MDFFKMQKYTFEKLPLILPFFSTFAMVQDQSQAVTEIIM